MATNTIGLLALVGVAGASSQWLAWRLKLPSILILLLSGILLGPVLGWLNADSLLGELLFPFVSIAVAIILFEGGLTLEKDKIGGHGAVVRNLLVIGVFITWMLIALTTRLLFDFTWELAFLFGAIGVVTGPTVIKPLLRIVRPDQKISQVLHWEGILVDPLGALLAILVFEYIVVVGAGSTLVEVSLVVLKLVGVGLIAGAVFGFSLGHALKERWIPDFLAESTTLLIVIAAFSVSELLQHEAGLLTVTVMGVWLANTRGVRLQEILHFKENLSILLISALFVLLASRLDIGGIAQLGLGSIAFLLVVQFIIRPLSVWCCTIGAGWTWQERVLTGWIAPRGIVAAAISSLFVLRLEAAEIEGAELLVPLAFVLIIGTVVFQSLSTKALAQKLGVRNPEPNGVLIVGANPVSQAIGEALRNAGIKIILVDRNQHHLTEARRYGLDTFYGHVTSAQAEKYLDLTSIGQVIALSRNEDLNMLAALHFRDEFGTGNVFMINHDDHDSDEPGDRSHDLTAFRYLFESGVTYKSLRKALSNNGRVVEVTIHDPDECSQSESTASKSDNVQISLSDNYLDAETDSEKTSLLDESVKKKIPDGTVLFAINSRGRAFAYAGDGSLDIEPGWRLLVLSNNEGYTVG